MFVAATGIREFEARIFIAHSRRRSPQGMTLGGRGGMLCSDRLVRVQTNYFAYLPTEDFFAGTNFGAASRLVCRSKS